jgi:hypothetical protein
MLKAIAHLFLFKSWLIFYMLKPTRIRKLRATLVSLKGKEIVQNRQLKLLLGADSYARFEDEQRIQKELREEFQNKPDAIIKYAAQLKKASLTYGRANEASNQGRHSAATKLFSNTEKQLERLLEYLSEQLYADASLVMWFDRNVHFNAGNSPGGSPDDFPRVITSRSLCNTALHDKVGMFAVMRTIRETKIDAIELKIEELTAKPISNNLTTGHLAAMRKIRKRYSD